MRCIWRVTLYLLFSAGVLLTSGMGATQANEPTRAVEVEAEEWIEGGTRGHSALVSRNNSPSLGSDRFVTAIKKLLHASPRAAVRFLPSSPLLLVLLCHFSC